MASADDAQRATNPRGARAWVKEIGRAIASKLGVATVSAIAAAALALYLPYFQAWLQQILGDEISGPYVLQTGEYRHSPPYELYLSSTDVDLKHGGTKVFGTQQIGTDRTWQFFGYFRSPILSLAYEGTARGGIGTGVYVLERTEPFAFTGYWIGVECKYSNKPAPEVIMLKCPCLLHHRKHPRLAEQYRPFLDLKKCEEVRLHPSDVRQPVRNCPTKIAFLPRTKTVVADD